MEYAIGNFVFMVFFFIIGLIIYVFVARWVFKINKIIDLQEKQIYILTMMARQNGVPGEALDSVLGSSVDPKWKKYLTGYEKQ